MGERIKTGTDSDRSNGIVITALSAGDCWRKASYEIFKNGSNQGDIIEILNAILIISPTPEEEWDRNFDLKFRSIFGDDRIDYASSVTFIEPVKNDSLIDDSEFKFPLCKPNWKDSYWGRMTRYDDKFNQVEEVLKILRQGKNVKRCEMIVYSPYDIKNMYKQPCLLSIDLKPRNKKLYLNATFRSQRVSKSGYADYTALIKMGKWLAEQSNMELADITIFAHSLHIHASGDEFKNTKTLLNTEMIGEI
jgi:hypothetical protein